MAIRITGLNELREHLERLRPEEVMARALAEQAQRMAARVREGLSEQPGGAGHDEPWLQSGALRGSVGAQSDGLQAVVGSSDPAAVPQELGTARMPPRPFLLPVAASMGEEVARAVAAAVVAALRGDSPDASNAHVDLCGDGPDGGEPLGGGAVAGGGVSTSTSRANTTVAGGARPAANGASSNHPAPNLFAGPGAPTDPVSDPGQGAGIDAGEYSPSRPGYHYYQTNNVVASAADQVTAEEMRDQMSRFAVPGQSPDHPVVSGQRYPVHDPVTGAFVGNVRTTVSPDGLTTTNRTLPGHILADGAISRTAIHNPDGSWSVITTGMGNNIDPVLAPINELFGPYIFNNLDEQLQRNIRKHHGSP